MIPVQELIPFHGERCSSWMRILYYRQIQIMIRRESGCRGGQDAEGVRIQIQRVEKRDNPNDPPESNHAPEYERCRAGRERISF